MVLIMGTIFFLSHQDGDTLHLPAFPGADKLAHMLAYGALAITFFWYFGKNGTVRMQYTAILTVILCMVYGVTDEFHQSFVPLRSVSGYDVVADTAGAAAIALAWCKSLWVRQKISVL